MIDLKLPKQSKEDMKAEMVEAMEPPEYPHWARLHLCQEDIDRVSMLRDVSAGDELMMKGKIKVKEVRKLEEDGKETTECVILQIEEVDFERDSAKELNAGFTAALGR